MKVNIVTLFHSVATTEHFFCENKNFLKCLSLNKLLLRTSYVEVIDTLFFLTKFSKVIIMKDRILQHIGFLLY